jgi:hypothetical protein
MITGRAQPQTWLIAAGIPEIGQARRLGHRMDRRVVEVYSHVADEVEAHIQTALKQSWYDARHTIAPHSPWHPEPATSDGNSPTRLQGSSRTPRDRGMTAPP